jgi:hypothetical protein
VVTEPEGSELPRTRGPSSYSETSPTGPSVGGWGQNPYQEAPTSNETAEFFHSALNAQFIQGSQHTISPPVTSSPTVSRVHPSDAVGAVGFLGRSTYLDPELQNHEGSAVEDTTELPHSSLTEDDWKVLNIRKAFDLPLRAVSESLISTFVEKCHPWMPVVDSQTLRYLQNGGDMSRIPLL